MKNIIITILLLLPIISLAQKKKTTIPTKPLKNTTTKNSAANIAKKLVTASTNKVVKKEINKKKPIVVQPTKRKHRKVMEKESMAGKKEHVKKLHITQKKASLKEIVKHTQLIKKTKLVVPKIVEPVFTMTYPLQDDAAQIKQHYGIISLNGIRYKNESVTFTSSLESDVYCNVDTAIVSEIYEDNEGLFTVFLKKGNYTIAFNNLASVAVNEKDTLYRNDIIGFLAEDETNHTVASLELMLLKNKTILNPEKYLQKVPLTDTLANSAK